MWWPFCSNSLKDTVSVKGYDLQKVNVEVNLQNEINIEVNLQQEINVEVNIRFFHIDYIILGRK